MRLAMPLQGTRLTLRSLEAADARGPYEQWMRDARVLRYLEVRHKPPGSAELERFIADMNADSNTLLLGIVLTAERRHIGNIKLAIEPRHQRGDIGILIGDTSVWGHGYAAEAIAVLSDHAFRRLGLHKLTAGFYAENVSSIRAFAKAGFSEEGRLPGHWERDGAAQDGVLMARIAPGP